MRRSGRRVRQRADGLLAGGGMVDADVGLLEAGDDNAGEILIVLDEEYLGGAFAACAGRDRARRRGGSR